MRNLFQLIFKYHAFLLFVLLEVVSFTLIANKNAFQHSVAFRVTNTISGSLYTISGNIQNYFNLKTVNKSLSEENTRLTNEIIRLQNKLNSQDTTYIPSDNDINFIEAKVINNSVSRPNNYITINKGARDGVTTDMGVVGSNGVVGIVSAVSDKFAIIETLLNNKSTISARLADCGEVGQLKWDGISYQYANLEDIPRHVEVAVGDTITTSGYSSIFPKDILLGIVEEAVLTDADATYRLKIRLVTDFKNIRYVKILKNNNINEIKIIEAKKDNGAQ